MKAQEVKAVTTFCQVHDPGLRRLGLKAQAREDRRQRSQRAIGFPAVLAHRDEIIGVADHHSRAACLPLPIKPVQV
jgi:hypothetical protein